MLFSITTLLLTVELVGLNTAPSVLVPARQLAQTIGVWPNAEPVAVARPPASGARRLDGLNSRRPFQRSTPGPDSRPTVAVSVPDIANPVFEFSSPVVDQPSHIDARSFHSQRAGVLPQIASVDLRSPVSGNPGPVPTSSDVAGGFAAAWRGAADAGVAVGDASRKAAVATASGFSRLGESLARSF
jgi:hypothetical protein